MNEWRPRAEGDQWAMIDGLPSVVVGVISGVSPDGKPLVDCGDGVGAKPTVVAWFADPPNWSECNGLRVIVAFADGNAARPILLGLLDPPPPPKVRKAKKLRVESEEELVIECGKAKIALRADGRIEIRGGHLISRSTGPNKIKGGTVHIN